MAAIEKPRGSVVIFDFHYPFKRVLTDIIYEKIGGQINVAFNGRRGHEGDVLYLIV